MLLSTFGCKINLDDFAKNLMIRCGDFKYFVFPVFDDFLLAMRQIIQTKYQKFQNPHVIILIEHDSKIDFILVSLKCLVLLFQ